MAGRELKTKVYVQLFKKIIFLLLEWNYAWRQASKSKVLVPDTIFCVYQGSPWVKSICHIIPNAKIFKMGRKKGVFWGAISNSKDFKVKSYKTWFRRNKQKRYAGFNLFCNFLLILAIGTIWDQGQSRAINFSQPWNLIKNW